jgi:hypothetical protein
MTRKIVGVASAVVIAAFGIAAVANGPYYAWPAWSQKIACAVSNCPRFVVLADWSSEAVLDRETGLVWERSPSTATFTWRTAHYRCNPLAIGGRLGWRVPTIQEAASLIDPSAPGPPLLPAGHPFDVPTHFYWTANRQADAPPIGAWILDLADGRVTDGVGQLERIPVWCVRGGQSVDPQ